MRTNALHNTTLAGIQRGFNTGVDEYPNVLRYHVLSTGTYVL